MTSIAIHGGAGNLDKYIGTGRLEEAELFLNHTIQELHKQLESGASALDVVTNAVVLLEDIGYFHAGKGTCVTTNGRVEMDASIMEGAQANAGSVAVVSSVRNPIRLARLVMEQTPHVLLVGQPAEALAEMHGLEFVQPDYFVPCDVAAVGNAQTTSAWNNHGTVGAVARDKAGNVAAATSTGGTLHKAAGRVGDTPIIGAGTFARNNVGAVSCTGYGEYFIRTSAASAVVHRVELLGESIGAAAGAVLSEVSAIGGSGGMIAIGSRGEVAMPYSTPGMYRASIDAWGKKTVGIL
ncbi:MAG: isoaspartyl peptidase/L-asparaginase [Bradyrhizobiaceae bacterium]|nr:isoaspartyl peptidase/L-asparaginase [Bradyrhizobiaceae bacterium]